jgi:hypothetical protein
MSGIWNSKECSIKWHTTFKYMQLTGPVLKKLALKTKVGFVVFNLLEPGTTTVSQTENRIFYRGETDRNNQSPAKCEACLFKWE